VSGERRIEKMSVPDALAVAVRLHQGGHLLEAEELYRGILVAAPEHPDALHFLGVLCHQLGRHAEGIGLVRRAVELMPEHADALSNLGNLLRDSGQLEEAEALYRRAIALEPRRVAPRNNLGVVLKNQKRYEEAVAEYRAVLALDPGYADAHHNLAAALAGQGRHDEAIAAARRALALRPDSTPAWCNLMHSLQILGNVAEATRVAEQWLAVQPGSPIAAHLLAAFGARSAPERASDGFVTEVFDGFAGSFDIVMGGLEYRAPSLIAERVAQELGAAAANLTVLDAGCGTGLCGPLLRPYARRLVGIDLSPRMLAQARERGGYDELVAAELTAFLAAGETPFDLIVSADTLVYIGDLEPFFAGAARRLRRGGLLVFSVEHAVDLDDAHRFRLEPTGRYSHSKAAVARALASAGLLAGTMTEAALRKERGQPVAGLIVSARAPAV
jgi:predicted TPR repeat methyltransferase